MYEQQIAECCKLLKLGSSIAQSSQKIKADNHPEFLYKILQVEVKFFRTAALVNHLTEQKTKGNLSKTLKQMSKLDLLILDEWGYVPLEQDGARLLFQVISECYEKRSLILTTNLEFSKWVTIFYDEQMTAAIIDRIVHHGHMIVFGGTSKRLKGALMKN